jgi:hypothetical protein
MKEYTTHPNPEQRESQAKFLAQQDESSREEHAFLFRVGNCTYRYYEITKDTEVTEQDWRMWLQSLAPRIREAMEVQGFKKCAYILDFRNFVLSKKDIPLDNFLRLHLSRKDFNRWMKVKQELSNKTPVKMDNNGST